MKLEIHLSHSLERLLTFNQEIIMALLDDLTVNVTKNTDAVPVKLKALSDTLGKNDDDLAAAVAANTPAAPTA